MNFSQIQALLPAADRQKIEDFGYILSRLGALRTAPQETDRQVFDRLLGIYYQAGQQTAQPTPTTAPVTNTQQIPVYRIKTAQEFFGNSYWATYSNLSEYRPYRYIWGKQPLEANIQQQLHAVYSGPYGSYCYYVDPYGSQVPITKDYILAVQPLSTHIPGPPAGQPIPTISTKPTIAAPVPAPAPVPVPAPVPTPTPTPVPAPAPAPTPTEPVEGSVDDNENR